MIISTSVDPISYLSSVCLPYILLHSHAVHKLERLLPSPGFRATATCTVHQPPGDPMSPETYPAATPPDLASSASRPALTQECGTVRQ